MNLRTHVQVTSRLLKETGWGEGEIYRDREEGKTDRHSHLGASLAAVCADTLRQQLSSLG